MGLDLAGLYRAVSVQSVGRLKVCLSHCARLCHPSEAWNWRGHLHCLQPGEDRNRGFLGLGGGCKLLVIAWTLSMGWLNPTPVNGWRARLRNMKKK